MCFFPNPVTIVQSFHVHTLSAILILLVGINSSSYFDHFPPLFRLRQVQRYFSRDELRIFGVDDDDEIAMLVINMMAKRKVMMMTCIRSETGTDKTFQKI